MLPEFNGMSPLSYGIIGLSTTMPDNIQTAFLNPRGLKLGIRISF